MGADKLVHVCQSNKMLGSNLSTCRCFMLQKLELSTKSYEPVAMKLTSIY